MSIKGKDVLVLGSSGFIGGAVLKMLPNSEAGQLSHAHGKGDFDLLDYHQVTDLFIGTEPQTVFMCAAVTGGSGLHERDPLAMVHDNLVMHANVFKACAQFGVERVVGLSSTTGYPATSLPVKEDAYFDGPLFPGYFNPGHTRRYIERLSAMYAHKFSTVWMRVSNAYGPGDNFDPDTSHVIAATVRKVAERQDPITIWGDGSNVRDAVYITDVAKAALLCADFFRPKGSPPEAFNFACGQSMSVGEILGYLLGVVNETEIYTPLVKYDTTKPQQIAARHLDTVKAQALLGWTPTIRMREGLKRTLEWYESR